IARADPDAETSAWRSTNDVPPCPNVGSGKPFALKAVTQKPLMDVGEEPRTKNPPASFGATSATWMQGEMANPEPPKFLKILPLLRYFVANSVYPEGIANAPPTTRMRPRTVISIDRATGGSAVGSGLLSSRTIPLRPKLRSSVPSGKRRTSSMPAATLPTTTILPLGSSATATDVPSTPSSNCPFTPKLGSGLPSGSSRSTTNWSPEPEVKY